MSLTSIGICKLDSGGGAVLEHCPHRNGPEQCLAVTSTGKQCLSTASHCSSPMIRALLSVLSLAAVVSALPYDSVTASMKDL